MYFEKRDTYTVLLILWLIATPILVGFVVAIPSGLTRDVEYGYTENGISFVRANSYNGSWATELTQTYVFDNSTYKISIVSLAFPVVTNPTQKLILIDLNLTAIKFTSDIYKIVIQYSYVGTGNLTGNSIQYDMDSYSVWGTGVGTLKPYGSQDISENGTIIFELETFQSLKLASAKDLRINFLFADPNYLPQDFDFFEVSIHFYKKDLLVSKENIVQGVLGFLAFMNVIIAVGITRFWNPLSKK